MKYINFFRFLEKLFDIFYWIFLCNYLYIKINKINACKLYSNDALFIIIPVRNYRNNLFITVIKEILKGSLRNSFLLLFYCFKRKTKMFSAVHCSFVMFLSLYITSMPKDGAIKIWNLRKFESNNKIRRGNKNYYTSLF